MISRSYWIITAFAACHLLGALPLVTSQSLPTCAPSGSDEEATICAQQQEKEGTVYKLHGNARIFYRSWILSADEITFDSLSGSATAEGHVVVEGGANDEHIEATRAVYNVQTEFGSFYNVVGTTGLRPRGHNVKLMSDNPFAFTGKLVEKRGPGSFVVHDGTVTSCQLPQPNWQFRSERVVVEVAGNARIYNSTFLIHGLPVLYLPFATHPVKKEPRQSGFLIPHVGRSSRKGAVVGDAYYWAINRSMDLTIGGEYYSQRGGSQSGSFRWRPSDTSFLDLTYFGVIDENNQGGEDVHLDGEGRLPWNFRGVANIEFLSKYAFRSAFAETFSQAVDSEVKSKIFLSRNSNGFSYNAEVGRYQNFQSTAPGDVVTILHAPGFEVSGVDHQLGNSPLLVSFDAAAEGLSRSERTFRTANLVGRFDFYPSVALPLHWQGWSLRPELGLRDTFYTQQLLPSKSANMATDDLVNRKALEASVDLRPPSLERVFQKEIFGRKLKHVLEPSLTYRYVTGVDNFPNILRFDSRDILSNTNEVEYGLTQRVYAKERAKEGAKGGSSSEEDCHDIEGYPTGGAQGESRSAKHPWQKDDSRTRPCPKSPATREIITWRIGQKYFLNSRFGGALVDGQRNVFETSAAFTGIAFLSDERRWSPLISRLRVQTTARSEAEWDLDYDFKKGRITSSAAIVNYHFGNITVGGSDNFLHTPGVVSDSGTPELSQFHQFRVLLGYGSASKRGWSAMSNFGFDANAVFLQYGSLQSTYNWDCCGVSLGYRRFVLSSVGRVENEYFFQFNLANIGAFGNLRRQDRLF
jgi:LPS-assembly protein